jgi:ribonuclease Z
MLREIKTPQFMEERKICGYTVIGYSKAARETSFYIEELGLCFDTGCKPLKGFKLKAIFIGHSHDDHSKEIKEFKLKGKSLDVHVPYNSVDYFKDFIKYSNRRNYLKEIEKESKQHNFIPVKDGDNLNLGDFKIKVISLDHSVSTCGYLFYRDVKKLKKEFIGKEKELSTLRKSGIIVEELILKEEFAYLLDTTIKVFKDHEIELSKFKFIICECTFIGKEEKEKAAKDKHMHWDDLKPYVEKCKDVIFVLTHFSKRYSQKFIHETFGTFENVITY